ncbi:MAG: KH domain-containing protein [Myxococcota bacterium]|nr:KH domain-containing protein [Myxococcota bacterium]
MLNDFATFLVKSVVREPDQVRVEASERRGEGGLLIRVAERDRGAVIGRQGRTIRAIQTVLDAAAHPAPSPALDVESV